MRILASLNWKNRLMKCTLFLIIWPRADSKLVGQIRDLFSRMWTTNLLPPANEVWDKVMFSQAFVCPHWMGVLASQHASQVTWPGDGGLHPGESASGGSASRKAYIQGGLHPGGWADPPSGVFLQGGWADTPKIHGILRDTVNKRAVRILLECILVKISNYTRIGSPLLKSKLASFLRSQVNQEVTLTDVARYLLLQTERDMTWTFEWIGIDGETFNDEHDQMSGALVWLWRTKHCTIGLGWRKLMLQRCNVVPLVSITLCHIRYYLHHLTNWPRPAARNEIQVVSWLQGSQLYWKSATSTMVFILEPNFSFNQRHCLKQMLCTLFWIFQWYWAVHHWFWIIYL